MGLMLLILQLHAYQKAIEQARETETERGDRQADRQTDRLRFILITTFFMLILTSPAPRSYILSLLPFVSQNAHCLLAVSLSRFLHNYKLGPKIR